MIHDDQSHAAAEDRARSHLMSAGAADLPHRPWLHPRQPASSTDLVHLAVWRGGTGAVSDHDVEAGLALLAAARAEVEALEAGMLFTARSAGWSWSRIGRAMGLGSAQAAVQRFDRISRRVRSVEER